MLLNHLFHEKKFQQRWAVYSVTGALISRHWTKRSARNFLNELQAATAVRRVNEWYVAKSSAHYHLPSRENRKK